MNVQIKAKLASATAKPPLDRSYMFVDTLNYLALLSIVCSLQSCKAAHTEPEAGYVDGYMQCSVYRLWTIDGA